MATIDELITQVRQRADMVGSEFVTDAEIENWCNQAGAELYDILVSRFDDLFIEETDLTIASGQSKVTLPSNLLKLRGVSYVDGGIEYMVRPMNFAERNKFTNYPWRLSIWAAGGRRYWLRGNYLQVYPQQIAPGTYHIYYVPTFPAMSTLSGDDLVTLGIGDPQFWGDFVVVSAAIKCLRKEESDTSELQLEKAALMERIKRAAASRDAGEPARVAEVQKYEPEFWSD